MNRDEILTKITDIFRDVFDDEDIVVSGETTAADIGAWDSLTHITLINDIESAFGCKFGMKEVLGFKNVGDILDLLVKLTEDSA